MNYMFSNDCSYNGNFIINCVKYFIKWFNNFNYYSFKIV